MNKQRFFYLKRTLRVAAPVVAENLMHSAVNMVDAAMVGSLGALATAAVAVNSGPAWLINGFPMGLSVGCTVLVARHIGAGERQKADGVASQGFGAALIFSAFLWVIMMVLSNYLPSLLNADAEIRPDAVIYLRTVSMAVIPHFMGIICGGMLRGAGNTRAPMLAALMTNVINVTLNFMLIFEPLHINAAGFSFVLPRAGLGVRGAAIATAVAQTVSGLFMFLLIIDKKQKVSVNLRQIFRIKKDTIVRILKIGLPVMGERITINLGQVFYQSIVNSLGAVSTAAHFIATTAESISYMPAGALSTAATTLVGQSLGAKNKEDAQRYAHTVMFTAIGFGLLAAALLFIFPGAIISLFTPDPDVVSLGSVVLRIIAPTEPFFCLLITVNGILRSGGDTVFSFIAGVIGMWIFRISIAIITVKFLGMGLAGAWIAMAADVIVRCFIMFLRYKKKRWLNINDI